MGWWSWTSTRTSRKSPATRSFRAPAVSPRPSTAARRRRCTDRPAGSRPPGRDRETIILGGYIRTNKSKTSSGVPLLKDIPLLGTAFRTKGSDFKRSELIVLIRPTVLNTPEDAAREAEEERNRLPGMRGMEEDMEYGGEKTGTKLNTLFGK